MAGKHNKLEPDALPAWQNARAMLRIRIAYFGSRTYVFQKKVNSSTGQRCHFPI